MTSSRITYTPRPDATPEAELQHLHPSTDSSSIPMETQMPPV